MTPEEINKKLNDRTLTEAEEREEAEKNHTCAIPNWPTHKPPRSTHNPPDQLGINWPPQRQSPEQS